MKNLTVREVPDAVYGVICEEATRNHRSIQEQVRLILEKEARLRRGGLVASTHKWRAALEGRDLGDTVKDIRGGRSRT